METFLLIIKIVSELMPVVSGLVHSVEQTFPSGTGPQKMNAVQSAVKSAFDSLGEAGVSFGQIWPMLEGFITSLVGVYNATGIFKGAQTAVNTVAQAVTGLGDVASQTINVDGLHPHN